MKHKSPNNKGLSIKWKVFLYLLIFALLIALVLWLCQVVFLDRIYKSVKIKEIKDDAEKIVRNINAENTGETVEKVGSSHNSCISVLVMSERGFVPKYYYHSFNSCVVHNISAMNLEQLYNSALLNGGTNIQRFLFDPQTRRYIGVEGDLFEKSELSESEKLPENIIYSVTAKSSEGQEIFILINSEISPLDATVNTINKILIFVTFLLVFLSMILALLISHRVTKPIRSLTNKASELAKGNYGVAFEEKGYSEISQLADTLNYAKTELSRVDTLRRELIANISHDLRTPLTMIGGYSEVMRDIPGENTPENIQVIIDETKRLSSLVNDVLDISKLESGNIELAAMPFNITKSTEKILWRFAKLCEKDGYNIEFFYDREAYVFADETRITQVIYNLVGNAITHTGESKRIIVRQKTDKAKVRIEVEDFGQGIEPEKLPDIWERYYKLEGEHRRAAIGTGLGLSIVRNIMEQSGGGYGVSSTVGKGSVFFIEMPLYLNGDNKDEQ
ncbi:MAG: HAMP domain-containing protein [Clostridia bacterium]|nr:HAMP domain-containing protein [Clostridia bacterium]